MISIVLTTWKEPKTLGRAIEALCDQGLRTYELFVCAPDDETLKVAQQYVRKNKKINLIQDEGKGKPSALNGVFKKLHGEFVVLTDGDVYVSNEAISSMLVHFKDKNIGGVSAKVESLNDRKTMFGFWASLLTRGVDRQRRREMKLGKNILCSGYCYMIRKNLFSPMPQETLADDAYISLLINKKGYRTVYEPRAKVYVKYPNTLPDWIRQKKRTAGKFYQLNARFKISKTSSLWEEILAGSGSLREIRRIRELFWILLLGIMRAYIWGRVFFDKRLWKRSMKKTWERVESTK